MTDGEPDVKPEPERTDTTREYRATLGEVSHTNPYTDEAFGETQTFGRGQFVAADGGRDPDPERERQPEADADADVDTDDGSGARDDESMRDVDHTPPDDGEGAAPVFERGNERRDVEEEDVR